MAGHAAGPGGGGAEPAPTAQELSAAVTLTGLSDDAPGYHPGMEISSTMNVQQMV